MSISREELKQLIDQISEKEISQVFDFISYLNYKREHTELHQSDIQAISQDNNLIRQVLKSQEDRKKGNYYEKDDGLLYLREKVEELDDV